MDKLIEKGAKLYSDIHRMTAELREINKQLESMAEFKNGKKTTHVVGAGYRVKIEKRTNIKWDQKKLLKISEILPDNFHKSFKSKYEPIASILKTQIEINPEFKNAIDWAKEENPGSPSVTYEPIEEDMQDAA